MLVPDLKGIGFRTVGEILAIPFQELGHGIEDQPDTRILPNVRMRDKPYLTSWPQARFQKRNKIRKLTTEIDWQERDP